ICEAIETWADWLKARDGSSRAARTVFFIEYSSFGFCERWVVSALVVNARSIIGREGPDFTSGARAVGGLDSALLYRGLREREMSQAAPAQTGFRPLVLQLARLHRRAPTGAGLPARGQGAVRRLAAGGAVVRAGAAVQFTHARRALLLAHARPGADFIDGAMTANA